MWSIRSGDFMRPITSWSVVSPESEYIEIPVYDWLCISRYTGIRLFSSTLQLAVL